MCGISALIATREDLGRYALSPMSDVVRHRGPDDEGFVAFLGEHLDPAVFGGADTPAACHATAHRYLPESDIPARRDGTLVALGHRRLSIIDLSHTGHQPMCSPDRNAWIVYNGEVYNHIELRAELERLGHRFASHSDTEVMLAAYEQWGPACLERFNGMFAFVLVDRARRRVLAARDRFGVKPLYYWVAPDGTIALASEIKQFTALPGWRAAMNGQRAYDFLAWGMCEHTDETLFAGVRQVRGGEAVELDLDALRSTPPSAGARLPVRAWYELRPRTIVGSLSETAADFRELLIDSVRLRLRADVPVGSCLSGGLDSSSIVCLMNDLLRTERAEGLQRTFSAITDVARYDERRYVDEVVRAINLEAHQVHPQLPDLFGAVDRITWHQDEPFGSTSIYAQWHVFKLAADHGVKVMLDGQGADESLAGYHVFFGSRLAALARRLRVGELLKEVGALRQLHGYGNVWSIRQALGALAPRRLTGVLRGFGDTGSLEPAWLDVDRLGARALHPLDELEGFARNSVEALSEAQLLRTSLPMLLHWEDRDSMAHSVEARVPFLDYRLVEFALGLPEHYKIHRGVTKRVLREAMSGILPELVRTRTDKLGFQTPEEEWMRSSPEPFRAALRRAVEGSEGIIRPAAITLFEDVIAGRRPFSFLPWRIIAFGAWKERFGVRSAR